jgi:hypothetical protein
VEREALCDVYVEVRGDPQVVPVVDERRVGVEHDHADCDGGEYEHPRGSAGRTVLAVSRGTGVLTGQADVTVLAAP